MDEVDLINRDPNDLNGHVKVEYFDSFGEPDGLHSIDCVWITSKNCFTCGRNCCYKTMTFIFGIFIALFWGCEFSLTAFYQIWLFTPNLRLFSIWCGMAQKCFGTCVNCYLPPICEAFGLMFSNIRIEKH